MDFIGFKIELGALTGLEKDALHIYAAVLIQLLAALVARRTFADMLPWVVVLALALLAEWIDLSSSTWPDRDWQRRESVHDVINTLALPTLLLLLARFSPRLLARRDPEPPVEEDQVEPPSD